MLKVKVAGAAAASTPLAALVSGAGVASLCWQERHNQAINNPRIMSAIMGKKPRDLPVVSVAAASGGAVDEVTEDKPAPIPNGANKPTAHPGKYERIVSAC